MIHSLSYSVTLSLLGLIIPFLVGTDDKSGPPERRKVPLVFEHAIAYLQATGWDARYEQIRRELEKGRKEPWEGQFYDSPFHGLSFRPLISRKMGFFSTGRRSEYGKVEVAENRDACEYRVLLISDLPMAPDGAKTYEYFMIRWSDRVYLVNPKDMLEFCNAVNSGRLRTKGQPGCPFLLREEDYDKDVSGLPSVPKQYAEYLLQKPIRGELVGHYGFKEYVAVAGEAALHDGLVVTLNVGYEEGVRTGMKFYPQGSPHQNTCTGYVIAVGKHDSDLLLAGPWVLSGGRKREPKDYPKGTKFSTVDR